jgi:hypothetical protein
LQIITVVAIAVGVCNDLVKQTRSKKTKRKAANAVIQNDNAPNEPVNSLVEGLNCFVDALSKKLNTWSMPNVVKDLSDHFSNLSVVIGDTDVVSNKLKEGHILSLHYLKQVLKDKLKYISGISS